MWTFPLPYAPCFTPHLAVMIDYVSGTLVDKDPESALVDVNGIGYRVHVPTSTYQSLPDTDEEVTLYTYHYLREDDESLYGFSTKAERKIFETMTDVSRVGPKLALSALSSMSPTELRDHVMEEDKSRLTEISGVGKKTADRLIVELRDPLADLEMDQRARCLLAFLHPVQDRVHLGVAHRHRTALRPEEPGDAVDRVDKVVAAIRHFHAHEDVAGHEALLGRHLLAPAHLDHFLGRNQHLLDLVLESMLRGRVPDLLGNLLLEVGQNAHRVPPLCHWPHSSSWWTAPARRDPVDVTPFRPDPSGPQQKAACNSIRRTPLSELGVPDIPAPTIIQVWCRDFWRAGPPVS